MDEAVATLTEFASRGKVAQEVADEIIRLYTRVAELEAALQSLYDAIIESARIAHEGTGEKPPLLDISLDNARAALAKGKQQ